jgi:chromate transporter
MSNLLYFFVHLVQVCVIAIGGGAQALLFDLAVTQNHWISSSDFASGLALAFTTPGPNIFILPVFIGYKIGGVVGSLVGIGGIFILPMILAGIVTGYLEHLLDNLLIKRFETGARSAIVGLLLITIWKIGIQISSPFVYGIILVPAFMLSMKKVNPAIVLIGGAIVGSVLGLIFKI